MGDKKLFSNKKMQTKKFHLCTAFGYNCFSIKSLLFWKEMFFTFSGARGSRGSVAGPVGAATGALPGRCFRAGGAGRSRLLAAALSCPFVPALHRPAASLLASFPSRPRWGHGAGEVEQRRGQWGRLDGEVPTVSTGPGGRAGPPRPQRAACRRGPGATSRRAGPVSVTVWFVLFLFLTRIRRSLPVLRREKGSR